MFLYWQLHVCIRQPAMLVILAALPLVTPPRVHRCMLGEKPLHSGEHATSHTAAGWLRRTVQPLQDDGRFEDKWKLIHQSTYLFREGRGVDPS